MLRLVPATVAVEDERRSTLDKRAPEGVDTGYHQRHGLYNARAAALPWLRVCVGSRFRSHLDRLISKIAACVAHTNRRRTSVFLTRVAAARRLNSRRSFAGYLLRSAYGLQPRETSKLLERPRLAQRANKSAPERTPDDFLPSGVRETKAPTRRETIPGPKPTSGKAQG